MNFKKLSLSSDIKTVLLIYLSHLVLGITVLSENAYTYHHQTGIKPYSGLLWGIPVYFFISLIPLIIYQFIGKRKSTKVIFLALLGIFNLYIIGNQIFFRIFFNNFHLSFAEGGGGSFGVMLGSISSEIDYGMGINFAFWLIITFFVSKAVMAEETRFDMMSFFKRTHNAIILTIISTLYIASNFQSSPLAHHPTQVLLESLYEKIFPREMPKDHVLIKDYTRLRFGEESQTREDKEKLVKYIKTIQEKYKKPNLVFIVLESVGSEQILPNGDINPKHTPILMGLKNQIIAFNQLYNTFPGTTRSHIPIMTGGRTMTWGSVFTQLQKKFKGPNLSGKLRQHGYKNHLVSAGNLDFENLGLFYKNLGFETFFDPAQKSKDFQEKNELSSWGIFEEVAWDYGTRKINWKKPFYLHYLSIAAHHPYAAPKYHKKPYPEDTSHHRYLNALHYNDFIIGRIIKKLKEKGVYKNTLIAIMGDHGQAFGKRHPTNFTHKNHIFEENIKNFFMLLLPHEMKGLPHLSNKVGKIGDGMNTVHDILSIPAADIPGRSLFDPKYQEEIVFFHKNASPERWGLRDGKWKFIETRFHDELKEIELYNLEDDPLEKKNLAGAHKEKTKLYRDLCMSWYVSTNNDFLKFFDRPFPMEMKPLGMHEILIPGPKRLAVGVKNKNGVFMGLKKIHPKEDFKAWVRGVPASKDTVLTYRWIAPDNKITNHQNLVKADWSTYTFNFPRPAPMIKGMWKLQILDQDDLLLETNFEVDPSVKLFHPRYFTNETAGLGPNDLKFGVRKDGKDFQELKVFHPREDLKVMSIGRPYGKTKKLTYLWTSPSKIRRSFDFTFKPTWTKTWVDHDAIAPMEEGTWTLTILDGSEVLLKREFVVNQSAQLIDPRNKFEFTHAKPGPHSLSFGVKNNKGKYIELKTIHPKEDMVAATHGPSFNENQALLYIWTSPSGKKRSFPFTYKKGWTRTWVKHEPHQPMEEGQWKLEIMFNQEKLIEGKFRVSKKAKLYREYKDN